MLNEQQPKLRRLKLLKAQFGCIFKTKIKYGVWQGFAVHYFYAKTAA